ncbi:MAG: restriction endonuclease subunit S [Planctomycetota bacterium]|nr:restriction endonuclease subunit S [Planctomycetota bacterium]
MKLGDLCEVVRGSSPRPKSDTRFYGGIVPRLMVSDLTRDGKIVSARTDTLTELGATQSRPMKSGDVVIAVSGAPGLPAILSHDCCIHDGFVGLRDLDRRRLNADFLYAYLMFVKETSISQAVGAIFKNLTTDQIKSIEIPEFPLSEQKRIADILDRAEALRAKRRAALAILDELTQSIFLDMFGNPVTNSLGLDSAPLGELLKFKSGEFLPAHKMATEGTFPVLGGNGVNGWHSEYLFEDRRIVVGRVGVYCGCVHVSPPQSWITDNALYVEKQDSRLAFDYLVHALTHARLNQYASQSGQPLISGSRIYPVHVLLPPLTEQIDFAKRIAGVEHLRRALADSNNELDQLFASLQHRAFRGEL